VAQARSETAAAEKKASAAEQSREQAAAQAKSDVSAAQEKVFTVEHAEEQAVAQAKSEVGANTSNFTAEDSSAPSGPLAAFLPNTCRARRGKR